MLARHAADPSIGLDGHGAGLARRSTLRKIGALLLAIAPGCGPCGEPAPPTAAAAPPAVRASLSCKTSRFAWLPTSTTSSTARAADRADPGDHHADHGHATELILPLVRGRSRCPTRGQILVRVTTPASDAPRSIEIHALGQTVRASVPAGADVWVPTPLALAGASPGRHPIEVRVDGVAMDVPQLDVTP